MTPRRYGPLQYVPINRRPKLTWPGGARVALWVNPNIEFFGLDDVMPGNLNERIPREHARIPNVRNWAVRDYGNRVGIWRIMEVLTRYGIGASAALNSEVCDHHPEIIDEAGRLGWELIGHNQTNALRLTEMDEAAERGAVRATIDRIEAASGRRPVGWLGAGLAETWNTLDYLAEAGIRYVCDWVNDDQPYLFEIGNPPLVSLPYSVQTNDVPAYFEMKVSVPEFEAMLRRQFDTLYREGETIPRVMAIAVHPFVTGQPHRIGALDAALQYICSHAGVWRATGWEIVQHFLTQQTKTAATAALLTLQPEPAECRQLQCRPDRVDSKTEAQQVYLKTLAGGEQDTEEPIKRHLKPGSAGCRGEQPAAPARMGFSRIFAPYSTDLETWRLGTPPRGSGRQKLIGTEANTRRAEATRRPSRDRHLSGTVGS